MRTITRVILLFALAAVLLAFAATAGARTTYKTSKAVLSNAPKKDRAFTATGFITPKSTSSNRAKVKIILWMEYGDGWGVMRTYIAKLSPRAAGGTRYSITITIPMKGDHGVQAVQYRGGKKVSKSAIKYFDVQP